MTGSVLWVGYPASYTKGRTRAIQFVTLHYTAGSEGPTSAESGAHYDKIRTDGTSTHYFVDSEGPALQEVPDGDRSHAARFHGNEVGVHIEICGYRQTRAQWLDEVSQLTLRTTAWLVATLIKRHGLAFTRLTAEQTRAAYYAPMGQRPTGINDHYACTVAFPEDGGDHEDVGAEFPWDVFMGWVQENLGGPMAKVFQLTEPIFGIDAGALYGTGGSGFFHLTWDEYVAYAKEWGIPVLNSGWPAYLYGPACQVFGPFLGSSTELRAGPKGDKGDQGEPGVGFAPGEQVTVSGTVTVS